MCSYAPWPMPYNIGSGCFFYNTDSSSSKEIGPGLKICNFSFVQSTIVLACNALHVPSTIPSIFGSGSSTVVKS